MGRSATTIARHIGKGLSLLAACFLALALGGCGGIEFQGKAFDYMGLSDVGKQKEDVEDDGARPAARSAQREEPFRLPAAPPLPGPTGLPTPTRSVGV